MKQIKTSLTNLPFPVEFVVTDAIMNDLRFLMKSRRLQKAMEFITSFECGKIADHITIEGAAERILNDDTNYASIELFAERFLSLMFVSYLAEHFKNPLFAEVMKITQEKFKLPRLITVIWAKGKNDYTREMDRLENASVVSADANSATLFFILQHPDAPYQSSKTPVYLSIPETMVIIPFGNEEMVITSATIEYDLNMLQEYAPGSEASLALTPR